MQRCPSFLEAASRSRGTPRRGRAPGTEANTQSGVQSEPWLEEPARLCGEAAGSTVHCKATSMRPSPSRLFPSPNQPDLGSWALIVLMKFLVVVVLVLECDFSCEVRIWGPAGALELEGGGSGSRRGLWCGRGSSWWRRRFSWAGCRNRGKKRSKQCRAVFLALRRAGGRATNRQGPTEGRLGVGPVSPPPSGAPGRAGEGCCFDPGTGWKRSPPWLARSELFALAPGTSAPTKTWGDKCGHLDPPNLWFGRYQCSPDLTGLFVNNKLLRDAIRGCGNEAFRSLWNERCQERRLYHRARKKSNQLQHTWAFPAAYQEEVLCSAVAVKQQDDLSLGHLLRVMDTLCEALEVGQGPALPHTKIRGLVELRSCEM
ncbi:uncharacterized protein LOC102493215 [Tupaia chinensis]|uniref:uncharacterized protein LOC102493215 n=1 Tax=Tupaia chinensis TaxID=246437 RepID=UPI000FFBF078|nr:uncharacterized protein LOC102493215 [Tupaia chinensis]